MDVPVNTTWTQSCRGYCISADPASVNKLWWLSHWEFSEHLKKWESASQRKKLDAAEDGKNKLDSSHLHICYNAIICRLAVNFFIALERKSGFEDSRRCALTVGQKGSGSDAEETMKGFIWADQQEQKDWKDKKTTTTWHAFKLLRQNI